MIEVYAFATSNSVKVPIALEELDLPYTLHAVNIRAGEQRLPEFVMKNRNAKVPVLVDPDAPIIISESAAILVYLAEKTGRLLPTSGLARSRVFEQLFFHASALSPAFGQAGYFQKLAPEPIAHAIERFRNEAKRVLAVLDATLAESEFVAGSALSIADIAHFGWIWRREFAGVALDDAPNVARWFAQLDARPAFQRGVARTSALAQPGTK
ncbi:MAG: glutathione S-transferase N-terminal domain-containing protein [Deltaproteobacteria bacterium]|nr:glutathione S-transferase N-terminal domain-containing protein [Nannocystaceae bacterium]